MTLELQKIKLKALNYTNFCGILKHTVAPQQNNLFEAVEIRG